MALPELRAALEQRLGALAIRTEVVEHPEVRRRGRRASVSWVQQEVAGLSTSNCGYSEETCLGMMGATSRACGCCLVQMRY